MIGPSMNPVANPVAPVNPGGWRNPFSHGQGGDVGPERNRMPMFHDGTSYVPHTGPALLEKGEAVIPKEENKHMNSVSDVLGGPSKIKAKKRIKEIAHSKSHNGKHIITHRHHPPHDGKEHEEIHALDNMSDVHSHIEDHAGTPNEGE